jgi:hypothetical protein
MATRPKKDKMGSIIGPAPKLTPKARPKKKAQGGPTGKPAPKYDKNGKRIFSGTGTVTKSKATPKLSAAMNKPVSGGKGISLGSVAKRVKSTAKRVQTTAREARDVVTAVGTVGKAAIMSKTTPKKEKNAVGYAAKNLVKQVKEVGTAAKTGKRQTQALQTYTTPSGGTGFGTKPRRPKKDMSKFSAKMYK